MRSKGGSLSAKGMAVVGIVMTLVSAFVLVVLFVAVSHTDLQQSFELAQETASFLDDSCEKYENYNKGYSAKSLQALMDTAQAFEEFLPTDKVVINDNLAEEFIHAEHIGGLIALDENGVVIAQADMDHADSYALWQDVLARPAVQNVMSHKNNTYTDVVDRDGVAYNFVALPYEDGLLVVYESLYKPSFDPYEYNVSDLLTNNTFHQNPTVVMVQGDTIVSSNDPSVQGKLDGFKDAVGAIAWRDDALTRIVGSSETWYGLRASYKDYTFYVLYPEDEVFANRPGLMAMGFALFLAVCVVILVVRGHFDKRNLRAVQKQMRIVDAISRTYDTTFLLHLATMRMEGIRLSPAVAAVFAAHPEPRDFLEHVCRDVVAPESREAVMELMDVPTIEQRLANSPFLGVDIKRADGVWYSLQVIPQRRDEQGRLVAVLVATRDVTAVKRAEELSFRDKLTGLRNRNYLESRDGELMRAGDFPVSVIMADCNYLKRTNDTLGHEWGDKLLRRVAGVLREGAGEECLVMRIGGDEFLLVCPRTGDVEAEELVERLRHGLAEASDDDLTLSVSFGVSTVVDGELSFDEAFKAADEAMYVEKQAAHAAEAARS